MSRRAGDVAVGRERVGFMQQYSLVLHNNVSPPHLRCNVKALRLPQAKNAWSSDLYAPHRNLLASKWPRLRSAEILRQNDRSKARSETARVLFGRCRSPCPPLIHFPLPHLSLQTYLQVIHHQDQVSPIPLLTFHSYWFSVLLCPCSPSLPNPTPLLSRRTTQRDFLFFAKKNDDHQVKSSLRDAVLPSSGVNVDGAACTPHARRAAAPCYRRGHRAGRGRNTRILNMTRVMRRRRATTHLNERWATYTSCKSNAEYKRNARGAQCQRERTSAKPKHATRKCKCNMRMHITNAECKDELCKCDEQMCNASVMRMLSASATKRKLDKSQSITHKRGTRQAHRCAHTTSGGATQERKASTQRANAKCVQKCKVLDAKPARKTTPVPRTRAAGSNQRIRNPTATRFHNGNETPKTEDRRPDQDPR
jgi:hypothetical protein